MPVAMKRSVSTKRNRKLPARRAVRSRKPPVANGLSAEFRFLTENAKALEAYPGEVLLISGCRLVVHHADMAVILKVIQHQKIRSPFIYRVPLRDESVFFSSF